MIQGILNVYLRLAKDADCYYRFKSYRQAFKEILRTKGPKGFVNGVSPAMVRAFPANAATFFAYEMAMKAMA